MKKNQNTSAIFGKMSEIKANKKSWGKVKVLFTNWGELNLNGYNIAFEKDTSYKEWADSASENLNVVEEGKGILIYNNVKYKVQKGFAFKIFPGQNPVISPQGKLVITSVQKPSSVKSTIKGENLNVLKIVDPGENSAIVYEYESLGQEIITPEYENGLGLIRFVFAIDKIPLHIHPNAGRLIRTVSGKGYTYMAPTRYEMNSDTFSLFPKGTTHTNGPVPGFVYTVWAFQLPWIKSEITKDDTVGSEKFVNYLGFQLPRELWKTKEDFYRAIKLFIKNGEKND